MSRRVVLLSFAVSVLWGSNFVAQKIGLRHADAIFLSSIRLWLAGTIIAVGGALLGHRMLPHRSEWPGLIPLGLCSGAMGALIYLSLARVGAGLGSILLYTFPLMTAALAAVVLGERISRRALVGTLIGFGGVALIAGRPQHANPAGIAFMLGAAAAWAVGSVGYKRVAADREPLLYTAWSLLIGGAAQSVVSLAVDGFPPHVDLGAPLVWSFLYMSIPGLAVAWALWFALLRSGDASRASALLFMTPALAVVSGWWLLDETITAVQLVGGALVAVAIVLVAPSSPRAAAATGAGVPTVGVERTSP